MNVNEEVENKQELPGQNPENEETKDVESSAGQEENVEETVTEATEEVAAPTQESEEAVEIVAEATEQEIPVEEAKETVVEEKNTAEVPASENKEEQVAEDITEIELEDAEHFSSEDIDIESFDKKEYVALAERMLDAINKHNVGINDVKNIDAVYKEIRAAYDEMHNAEIEEAKMIFVEANGTEDGFEFKNSNYDIRFESIMIQIKDRKNEFFKNLDLLREDYFERKTNLLQKLREVVEEEEKGGSKANWDAFKQIQNEWRDAGNIHSPHNGSLWSAYNALLDRYFDIRSIQNELKELDRKKNLEVRESYVVKIEEIAESLKEQELTPSILKKANELLNEYKHTGPGTRAEQEQLWDRMKAAFDVIYDKKRGQNEENSKLMEETLAAKKILVDKVAAFDNFNSDRINDWNAKTKELLEIQEQWNKLKGPMPRDKAKDISKDFWSHLKTFFRNKSAFFNELEKERNTNLKAKEGLCLQVEAMLAEEDTSADNTNKVIALQKEWKNYGHVPQKYKDSIYERFKKACDAFFELKRSAGSEQDKQYLENLKAKEELCTLIENEAKAKTTDMDKLQAYKKQFNEIGFVPRKDMAKIQKRFIDAINAYVLNISDLNKEEKEKLTLRNEVEVSLSTGGNSKNLNKQEGDLRRKLKSLEDEVNQLKTNIEFFGRSKGAEKFKAEYEKKIEKIEQEAEKIREKLQLINSL